MIMTMKKIMLYKGWLLSLLAMIALGFTSCDKDIDSNPTLDTSHAKDGFVLNVPANAANNTYDLSSSEGLQLTCNQPNYGGVPYVTRYFVQVAIDPQFKNGTGNFKELGSSFTTASMNVATNELNDSIVKLFTEANPDTKFPDATPMPIYLRLRAIIDNTGTGESFSNVIELPSVLAEHKVEKAKVPENLFIVGSSIQDSWNSWKKMAKPYSLSGQYFTLAYFPAGAEFKCALNSGEYSMGYSSFSSVNDNISAGVTAGDNDNVKVANAGWYLVYIKASVNDIKNVVEYTLNFEKAEATICGAAVDAKWGFDAQPDFLLAAPADASGIWESPAFTASGELRAFVTVPDAQWWQTEFSINDGKIYWRDGKILTSWTEIGSQLSISCSPGQKLYVNFDKETAEVR